MNLFLTLGLLALNVCDRGVPMPSSSSYPLCTVNRYNGEVIWYQPPTVFPFDVKNNSSVVIMRDYMTLIGLSLYSYNQPSVPPIPQFDANTGALLGYQGVLGTLVPLGAAITPFLHYSLERTLTPRVYSLVILTTTTTITQYFCSDINNPICEMGGELSPAPPPSSQPIAVYEIYGFIVISYSSSSSPHNNNNQIIQLIPSINSNQLNYTAITSTIPPQYLLNNNNNNNTTPYIHCSVNSTQYNPPHHPMQRRLLTMGGGEVPPPKPPTQSHLHLHLHLYFHLHLQQQRLFSARMLQKTAFQFMSQRFKCLQSKPLFKLLHTLNMGPLHAQTAL